MSQLVLMHGSPCPDSQMCDSTGSWEAVHFFTHTPWAGNEVAHLHPFRPALMKLMKIAELTDWQDLRERWKQWPSLLGFPESMPIPDHKNVFRICLFKHP